MESSADIAPTDPAVVPMGGLWCRRAVSERDLERARVAKREMGCLLGEALVRLGLVAELNVVKFLAEELGVAVAEKEDYPEEPMTIDALPEQFLFNNSVVPLSITSDEIVLSALQPQDAFISKALRLATGKRIELRLGVATDIEAALERYSKMSRMRLMVLV